MMSMQKLTSINTLSKAEVPRDFRNSKVQKQDKLKRDWFQHKNTCKSKSGIGPGVRRSKRSLSACPPFVYALCKPIFGEMSDSVKKLLKVR